MTTTDMKNLWQDVEKNLTSALRSVPQRVFVNVQNQKDSNKAKKRQKTNKKISITSVEGKEFLEGRVFRT